MLVYNIFGHPSGPTYCRKLLLTVGVVDFHQSRIGILREYARISLHWYYEPRLTFLNSINLNLKKQLNIFKKRLKQKCFRSMQYTQSTTGLYEKTTQIHIHQSDKCQVQVRYPWLIVLLTHVSVLHHQLR